MSFKRDKYHKFCNWKTITCETNQTKIISNIYKKSQENTSTGVSFLMKLHTRGLKLYLKETYEFISIF